MVRDIQLRPSKRNIKEEENVKMKYSIWTRLHYAVNRFTALFCRHPQGIICEHRHYDHDLEGRGYNRGFEAGKSNMSAKWRGSLSGKGPYANYPVPTERITI